ncbi:MAG: radical SAM protein [Anaerolineae bacterium]
MPTPEELARRALTRLTHRVYALPVLVLMPYGGCNGRCLMCDIWRRGDHAELSPAHLAPHLPDLRALRVRRVALSGGEALLHSDLWALCDLLSPLGLRFTLLTNGLLLEEQAREIVRWCDQVIVSLDGPRAVHDAIRGLPGAYDRLAQGVKALRRLDPHLPISARCVVQRRNFRDLEGTIAAAQELGLDRVSFLAADVSSAAFNHRPGAPVADVALSSSEVAELGTMLEEVIARRRRDFTSGFISESPAKLRRLVRYYAALAGQGDFPEVECNAPWVSALVEADGAVRPCFFQPALGSLHDRPLEQLLNSPEARVFRRELDVRRDPVCRRCVCTLNLGLRADV